MTVYYISKKNDEIYHFGIKGMKWGVRRWQNADGTLTEAGKAKYGSVETYEKARAERSRKLKTAAKIGAGVAIVGTGAAIALTNPAVRRTISIAAQYVKMNLGLQKAPFTSAASSSSAARAGSRAVSSMLQSSMYRNGPWKIYSMS